MKLSNMLALSGVVMLAGCMSMGQSGSGSAVGAFADTSSRDTRPLATTIVEAMAGGLIGGTIGQSLDQRDRRRALEAEYRALEYTPVGQPVAWGTRGSGRYGEVKAGSPYRVGSQDCRQYEHTVVVSGRTQQARGTACRNQDGSWTPLV